MIRKTYMTFFDGIYDTFTNVANSLSRIYQMVVPKGQVWELDPSRPFVLYLLAKETDLTPVAETDGTVTPSTSILIPKKADGNDAPAGRYEVLVGTVGGTKQRLTVSARTSSSITFSGTIDVGTKVDAFFIPDAAARLQLRVEDPRYMVTLDQVTLAEDPSVLMAPNPYHRNSMYHLAAPMVIPSDFILSIWIDAAYTVAWQDTAATPANLPVFMQLPIIVYSEFAMPTGIEERVAELLAKGD